MRGCDMAQSPSTALQPDAARRVLVAFEYSLPSEVARVSSFVDDVMSSIDIFRVTPGIEVDIEIALREALLNAIIHATGRIRTSAFTLQSAALQMAKSR